MSAPENCAQKTLAAAGAERKGIMMVPFRMPFRTQQQQQQVRQWPQPKQQKHPQPQFVVFELVESPQLSVSATDSPAAGQSASDRKFASSPSVHLTSSQSVLERHQQQWEGEIDVSSFQQQRSCSVDVCFATVQFGPSSYHSRGRGRLLFDNPMFRRLPNWHFFGDDRRLMSVSPLIPLMPPVPVERTLLYIAPSVSSTRQLFLCTLLDSRKRRAMALSGIGTGSGGKIGDDGGDSREQKHPMHMDGSELEEGERKQCASSSGVDSMSSEETTITSARSSPTTVASNEGGSTKFADEEAEEEQNFSNEEGGGGTASELIGPSSPSSPADSVVSSTPNSPPALERRIVRMSRGTRDAVRRWSRKFSEGADQQGDETEEGRECWEQSEAARHNNHTENAVPAMELRPPPPAVSMMSTAAGQSSLAPVLRSRHASAGSNCSTNKRPAPLPPPPQQQTSAVISDDVISRMDVLSERILNFHQNEDQTQEQLSRKLQLRDQLYYAISPIFPMCGLYIVGSSLNGFGTKRSDLDLCLMITNRDIDQRSDAVVVLSSVMRTLENNKMVDDQKLIPAKVPILRIKFNGPFSDILVDLNVNNSVAIRNTHLMCYYSFYDWRVRALVMIVKEWAKRRGINNASCSSFTSYSLVLMVIHYLQCGAKPRVLPNLQQMYPKRFNTHADVRTLNVSLTLDPIPTELGWKFDQTLSLSELLLGFLHYFAYQFDFDVDAISIRMGTKVNRAQVAQNQSPFNTLSQWHCICIEEPFTLSNAAHSIYDDRIFQDIKKAFVESFHDLDKHRDLDRFLGPSVDAASSSTHSDVDEHVISIVNGQIRPETRRADAGSSSED